MSCNATGAVEQSGTVKMWERSLVPSELGLGSFCQEGFSRADWGGRKRVRGMSGEEAHKVGGEKGNIVAFTEWGRWCWRKVKQDCDYWLLFREGGS